MQEKKYYLIVVFIKGVMLFNASPKSNLSFIPMKLMPLLFLMPTSIIQDYYQNWYMKVIKGLFTAPQAHNIYSKFYLKMPSVFIYVIYSMKTFVVNAQVKKHCPKNITCMMYTRPCAYAKD